MKFSKLLKRLIFRISFFLFLATKIKPHKSVMLNIINLSKGHGKILININSDFKFIVRDLYDIFVLKEVFNDHIYDRIFRNLKPNTSLIDIGAYIGDSAIYATKFKNISRIIAIEPSGENMNFLKKNLKLNRIKNVQTIRAAVAGKIGKGCLYIYPKKLQSSLITTNGGNTKKLPKESVQTISLSNILKNIHSKNIIIKSDSEGGEYQSLLMTPLYQFKKVNKIIFEYHVSPFKLGKIINYLHKARFKTEISISPLEKNLGLVYAYKN